MKFRITCLSVLVGLVACEGAPPELDTEAQALAPENCDQHQAAVKGAAPAAFAGPHQPPAAHGAVEPRVTLELAGAPVRGPENAKVTVVVYSDFQCPFCAKGATRIHELEKMYGDKVRFAFKHLPLPFHPDAKLAAAAAIAAQRQGKFWELHDRLFANQRELDREGLVSQAKAIGLNVSQFEGDLEDPEVIAQVERDQAEAKRFGINGTPTFFVNGRKITGAQPLDTFRTLIDAEL
jgi:protein-disulfide isomerase